MDDWQEQLSFNPIPALLGAGNQAITYFARRDLLGEDVAPIETLWEQPDAERLLHRQQEDGSWKYPGGREEIRSQENYNLLETFRNLGWLVEKYGFDRRNAAIQQAAGFLFAHQTEEGDIRGIMGSQYATHYTAGMLELLIKAGYADDLRVEKGMQWLLSTRQNDGGWAFPMRSIKVSYSDALRLAKPIQPVRSKPFSHLLTGVVLRAFAAHPGYRSSPSTIEAGNLLISRFFKPDKYIDRRDKGYWEKVSFPFWFTDIVSALDSLSWIGFSATEPGIEQALGWLRGKQSNDGFFRIDLLKVGNDRMMHAWVCLAVCRLFKRFFL
jgi:hypothetical protein